MSEQLLLDEGTVERLLGDVRRAGRERLHEHEVYRIVHAGAGIEPPRHVFVAGAERLPADALAGFRGERLVLKVVSCDVVHKSDSGGVVFCGNRHDVASEEVERLIAAQRARDARVEGVLIVEFVEGAGRRIGDELFVGLRVTREFGPVVAAGLGGVDTEFLARSMRPGLAMTRAVALDTTPEEFMAGFTRTAAYEMVSGRGRGRRRGVGDDELYRCFAGFLGLARAFCVDRGADRPTLAQMEVNPFAMREGRLAPLDGRGRLGPTPRGAPARPRASIGSLLEPRSIAIVGVSAREQNFGRVILGNILRCGFDRTRVRIVKQGAAEIDGVECVPSVENLPSETDLLVVAASGGQLPEIVERCVESGRVRSAILIPGGAGETEGSGEILRRVREAVSRGRSGRDGGLVLLGPNCLGVQSRAGKYDTFFIPESKLAARRDAEPRGVALVSQSGAFIVSRLSKLARLDPALTVSVGNQSDLTVSDMVRAAGERADIHTIGVYVEGFNDLDGLAMLGAVREIVASGREVVFYKAGRTEQGRDAAAGHTASVAGDYDVCESGVTTAGAMVAGTFDEFEDLLCLSAALHGRRVGGTRLGAITNAGFEAVGIADGVGPGPGLQLPRLPEGDEAALRRVLGDHGLAGLVNARNPLDLTPMAGEAAYEAAARVMLGCAEIDALVLSAVPLTPALATTRAELESRESLAGVVGRLASETDKPIVVVVDAGAAYDPLVERIGSRGVPVFRSADRAMRALGRYLSGRVEAGARAGAGFPVHA